ncbi:substrate-binding domain-containing protein [Ovoidimarina sediminis]|uniref:4,5-dihydroxyphthalate decarboxylase n=1 Tax=Ovoidimarina sediminis TaxID=3079856 RepID=UPI0029127C8E|nr:4,5-dihydroxyphthalate decarboxylase [Rhodophyticola sp. MJ-SS7]MDU8944756.1 4,5-dihydroxyphthalate decarboxylase [Rhodophyticola sp. MJ-SS7]
MQGDVLKLSFATWDHDRVMALHEGSVEIEGVRLRSVIAPTSELFPAAVADAPYDITEMSISSYVLQVARGEGAYIALPAFVARSFRHQGFFARAGSGIESPADFKGRRIGVPEYQMTAALWMRGILRDEYAVNAEDVRWRTGALDAGVRRERLELDLPDGMEVAPIAEGETLQDLLIAGEIDGLLAPKPPQAFLDGDRRFIRLFPDYEAAERAYHAKTGFFPIMHVIGVRRTLLEAYPWLARKLYDALVAGKKVALDRLKALWLSNANRVSLPWFGAGVERTMDAFGPDWWPYGFTANRAELDAICRYSVEQHLAGQRVAPEALFPKDLLTT